MSNKLPTYGVNSPTSTPTRPEYTVAAAPGLDDDAVERAAKAMYNQSPEMWFNTQMIPYPSWDQAPVYVKAGARIMARAAIAQAAGVTQEGTSDE